MRRYRLVVQGREYTVDVSEVTADRFQVRLDGAEYEVELVGGEDLPQATISPAMGGPLIVVSPEASAGPPLEVAAPPPPRPAPLPAPPPSALGAPAGPSAGLVNAPMPGTVVAVDVSPGQRVARGDQLLTLEAMKMNNSIRAPADGVVAEVLVAPGQAVGYGAALVRLERAGP